LRSGEEVPGQLGSAALLAAQLYAGVLFRLGASPLCGRRVHGNHSALQRRSKLPGGLMSRPDQDFALHRPGLVIV